MKYPKKLIYVAGPITAPTKELEALNIKRGFEYGLAIWKLGAVALIPHLNTPGEMIMADGPVTVEDIYEGDLTILERCDAMLRIPGWQTSRGVNLETRHAIEQDILIFDDLIDVKEWLERVC